MKRSASDYTPCVLDGSTLRVTFSRVNKLSNKNWIRLVFKRIAAVITKQSVQGDRIDLVAQGETIECEIASSPASLKSNPCFTLQQNFNGAILMLKAEPATNSLILFLGGFPEINCGTLNGEVKKIFSEATYRESNSSAFFC